jgi:thiamine pyrophosphate-dependent acetolactate synthase large subunit-like protein
MLSSSCVLHNPDFCQLARACGALGVRAETPEQRYEALSAAWGNDVPTVIEVPVEGI